MQLDTHARATQNPGHRRIRAAIFTALAMVSAGIAVAGLSEWIAGSPGAALVAIAGAAVAVFAGVRAYRNRAGSTLSEPDRSRPSVLEELDRRTSLRHP
jgi:hypothetical protein